MSLGGPCGRSRLWSEAGRSKALPARPHGRDLSRVVSPGRTSVDLAMAAGLGPVQTDRMTRITPETMKANGWGRAWEWMHVHRSDPKLGHLELKVPYCIH